MAPADFGTRPELKETLMKIRSHCLLLLLCVPLLAQAQAYKCKQADGTESYQDAPCAAGTEGTKITLPQPQSGTGDDKRTSKQKADAAKQAERDFQKRRAEAKKKAQAEEAAARTQIARCNSARNQLGALKEQRPIFTRDDNGDRHYLSNDDRAAAIAADEQRVAAECH